MVIASVEVNYVTRALQRIKNFARIRKSWFGEGGEPAAVELAQQRANICNQCPMNYKGEWLWNIATQIAIAARSELRRIMNLRVEGEEKLGVCEVCGCKLKIKIWTPFKHIYRQTTPEQLSKYPDHCWITKEKPQ